MVKKIASWASTNIFSLASIFVAFTFLVSPVFAQDKLVVAAYPSNPPFETRTPDGKFEGFEVDIVNEIAKRLKITVEFLPFDFQPLFAAVSSGRADFAISAISITPERLKSLAFTQPYYDADAGLGTRQGSAVKKFNDLKGKAVGYIAGTTSEAWVKANEIPMGFTSKSYKTLQDMVLDLKVMRVDAALSDVPTLEYTFVKMKDLIVSDRFSADQRYGMMTRKNHPLLERINSVISEMKTDGSIAAIHKKHFGTDAPASSSTVKIFPIPK